MEQINTPASNGIHWSIRTKVLISFALLLIITLTTVDLIRIYGIPFTTVTGEYSLEQYRVFKNLNLLADLQKQRLVHWLKEIKEESTVIAESDLIALNLERLRVEIREIKTDGRQGKALWTELEKREVFQLLRNHLSLIKDSHDVYINVNIIDPENGSILVSALNNDTGMILQDNKFLSMASGLHKYFINTDINPTDSKSILNLYLPIKRKSKVIGILIMYVNTPQLIEPSLQTDEGLGNTGEVILVNDNAVILTPLKHTLDDGTIPETFNFRITDDPDKFTARGEEGIIITKDYRNHDVLAAYRHIPLTSEIGWGMVVKRDVAEVFAPIKTKLINSFIITFFSTVLSILVILLIVRKLLTPIVTLSNTAKKVQKGDLKARAPVTTSDEVGALSMIFNSMVENIQHWHSVLEKEVDERTEQLNSVNKELEMEISERRKTENTLKASEERYRSLQENVPVGIFRTTSDWKFVSINPGIVRILGYQNIEEVMNTSPIDMWVDIKRKKELIRILQKNGSVNNFELQLRQKNGNIRWVSTSIKAVPRNDAEGFYIDGVIEDITEQKQLEDELQKSHKLESIGILAGGIAHDFNNLLSGILNNVYLSKIYIDPGNKALERLESAENAIQRASNLTQQLLTFSKGGAPVKKTASIIEIIKESANFALRGSNVKCEYKTEENLWPVEVDEGQIDQVIHNLILNAAQAMPEGGSIHIHTKNFLLTLGTGLPIKEGKYVKTIICDEGIGIDEEHQQKIFDPYFTTKEMGRGLGLSITYSIIKQHAGHITLESDIGVGTTFSIFLPASGKQIEEKMLAEDINTSGNEKILLMDDEHIIRDSVSEFLTQRGYNIVCSEDGEKAIALYQKAIDSSTPFDAVILDLTVRGKMGGKETVKKLLEINPDLKAIVSSGYSNDPVMAHYEEYGFCGVFHKASNSPDDLCAILRKVINGNS